MELMAKVIPLELKKSQSRTEWNLEHGITLSILILCHGQLNKNAKAQKIGSRVPNSTAS